MASSKAGARELRSGLSFEEFIELATTAALRGSIKVAAEAKRAGLGEEWIRPQPIWVGIWIRERFDVAQLDQQNRG